MIVEGTFYNIRCDICGEDACEMWWNNKDDAHNDAENANYKELGGKHYCPNCYHYDELNGEDIVVTADGRRFYDETEEEIKEGGAE